MVKYEKEIKDFFREKMSDTHMTEDEFQFVLKETLSIMGKTYQSFSDDIEVGVKNGHSVEKQFEFIERLL